MDSSNVESRNDSSLRIFISYRREDTQSVVGRLYDKLVDAFGEECVLKDVDSIPFGVDFRDYSIRLAQESDVVLVLIGPLWLERRDDGTRRIDDEADLVRMEVEAALRHCSLVIPVVVGGAAKPSASDLPGPIAGLAFRNAAQLRHDPDFRGDCARLIQQLDKRGAARSTPKLSPVAEAAAAASSRQGADAPKPGTCAGEVREFGETTISFCWCPAGTCLMGSPESDDNARWNEKPQNSVTLTNGFWLGRTAVTQRQWKSVMSTEPWKTFSDVRAGDDYPAVCISWKDATAFCATLTERERATGRLSWKWAYALPTESQWEYACRAGTTTRYWFGDDDALLGECAWFDRNTSEIGANYAHPVGKKRANPWGLCDMHGNVSEWCQDIWKDRPGKSTSYSTSAIGSIALFFMGRICRGGSWISPAEGVRSAVRCGSDPSNKRNDTGFRVACARIG